MVADVLFVDLHSAKEYFFLEMLHIRRIERIAVVPVGPYEQLRRERLQKSFQLLEDRRELVVSRHCFSPYALKVPADVPMRVRACGARLCALSRSSGRGQPAARVPPRSCAPGE